MQYAIFNEDALGQEIKRIWGEYGAHYEVYKMILEKAKKEADLTPGSPDSTNPTHLFLAEENRRLKETVKELEVVLNKTKTELEAMYALNKEGWGKVEYYEKKCDLLTQSLRDILSAKYEMGKSRPHLEEIISIAKKALNQK